MSRYVKEFANAQMIKGKNGKLTPTEEETNRKIRHIVDIHKEGLITDFDAVSSIVYIIHKYR